MLTNWYVRRSRQRFFDENVDAFDALYTALETVCRVAAPLLPLVSEEIWRGLTGGRSVHLADWPDAGLFPANAGLVEAMDRDPADLLHRLLAAQGRQPARAPAAAGTHRRGTGRGRAGRLRRRRRR